MLKTGKEKLDTKTVHEALHNCNEVLSNLAYQNEKLNTIENTVEENEYLIQRSLRIVRGMTWYGAIVNAISRGVSHKSTHIESSAECGNLITASNSEYRQSKNVECTDKRSLRDEEDLKEVEDMLCQLQDGGYAISHILNTQERSLNRIYQKSNDVENLTLKASILTSKRINKLGGNNTSILSRSMKADIIGVFELYESGVLNRKLSMDRNHTCVLVESCMDKTTSTQFVLSLIDGNQILYIQHSTTGRYLGITYFGGIVFKDTTSPSSYEYCYMDTSGSLSGILILAANWGAGGWLKFDDSKGTFTVSSNHTEKNGILQVRAVRISGK